MIDLAGGGGGKRKEERGEEEEEDVEGCDRVQGRRYGSTVGCRNEKRKTKNDSWALALNKDYI